MKGKRGPVVRPLAEKKKSVKNHHPPTLSTCSIEMSEEEMPCTEDQQGKQMPLSPAQQAVDPPLLSQEVSDEDIGASIESALNSGAVDPPPPSQVFSQEELDEIAKDLAPPKQAAAGAATPLASQAATPLASQASKGSSASLRAEENANYRRIVAVKKAASYGRERAMVDRYELVALSKLPRHTHSFSLSPLSFLGS